MSRKLMVLLIAALLGGAVLAAAGCGGGDDESTAATSADTTAIDTTEADTTEAETDTTESESDTTEFESDTTEDSSTDALPEDCRELATVSTKLGQAFSGTATPDTKDYAEFMEAFAERAPEEIREDFQVLADAYGKIADALEGVDLSPGAIPSAEEIAKLQAVVTKLDQPRLTKAGTNIAAWVRDNCAPG